MPSLSITAGVQRFTQTKGLRELVNVAGLIVSQGRAVELAYGGYCAVRHPPSRVYACDDEAAVGRILARLEEFLPCAVLSRHEVEELYAESHAIHALPADLAFVRRESILYHDGGLILGEYGEGARLACVTPHSCLVDDYYHRLPDVRHIHSLQQYGDAGGFLVCTGDARKSLDLWRCQRGELRFEQCLRRRLAGYTAAVELNGQYYFGSDFSQRPNFIATLGGAKHFFPKKAYTMHVAAFHALFDQYIVAVNKELDISGGRRTLSIFDTRAQHFVYCDYMPS